MTDYANLQYRCQRGEPTPAGANNLLAECYGELGKLVAENERLESEAVYSAAGFDAAREEIARLKAENAGLRTGYQAYERVNAELKAENEAIRKAMRIAASRMTDAKTCFDRDFPGEWSGELHLAVAIKEIDAAMGKGEQS